MAIYHLHAKIISRKDGRSTTAAAGYRSGEKIIDERTGLIHDYSRKKGVIYSEVIMPVGSEWQPSRSELWNSVELKNKRADSQVAREFEVAFPIELTDTQCKELAKSFAQEIADKYCIAADVSIHKPGKRENPHAHILTSTNKVEGSGFGNKVRELNMIANARDEATKGQDKNEVDYLRERWEILANEKLQSVGIESRIDRRTLKEQGITDREPTQHEGVAVTAMERKGIKTEIREENERRKRSRKKLQVVGEEISALEVQVKELEEEVSVGEENIRLVQEREEVDEAEQTRKRELLDEFVEMQSKHLGKIVLIKDGDNFLTSATDAQEIAQYLDVEWKSGDTLTLDKEQLDILRRRYDRFDLIISDKGKEYCYERIEPFKNYMFHRNIPFEIFSIEDYSKILRENVRPPFSEKEELFEPEENMAEIERRRWRVAGEEFILKNKLLGEFAGDELPQAIEIYGYEAVSHDDGAVFYHPQGKASEVAFVDRKTSIELYDNSDKTIVEALILSAKKWPDGFYIRGDDEFRARAEALAKKLGIADKVKNPLTPISEVEATPSPKVEPTSPIGEQEQQKHAEPISLESYEIGVSTLGMRTNLILKDMQKEQKGLEKFRTAQSLDEKIKRKQESVEELKKQEGGALKRLLFTYEIVADRKKGEKELAELLKEREKLGDAPAIAPQFKTYTPEEARRLSEEKYPEYAEDVRLYEAQQRERDEEKAAIEAAEKKRLVEEQENERAERVKFIVETQKSLKNPKLFITSPLYDSGSYDGKILAMSDRYVIQELNDKQAILHDLKKIPSLKSFSVGDEVTVDCDQKQATMRAKEQENDYDLGR